MKITIEKVEHISVL